MEKAELEKRVAELEKENQFLRDVVDGHEPKGPASRGCPKCQTCGRDGSQAAVMREACLRLVLEAQRQREALEKRVAEMQERVADADKVLVRQFQQDYQDRGEDSPELPIPPPCFGDYKAQEALRLWRCSDGSNAMMVRVTVYTNPYQWGMVLADAIRYISECAEENGLHYQNENGEAVKATSDEIMERMLEGFNDELEDPTDTPTDWTPDA